VTIKKKRWYLFSAATLITVAFLCGFVVGQCSMEPKPVPLPVDYTQHALLTWKGPSGDLCFKIMFLFELNEGVHSRSTKTQATCGISELKAAIGRLPKGADVDWSEWPGKFGYPEPRIVDELVQFAKEKDIQLKIMSHLEAVPNK
jgi:hypothetical protein